MYYYLWLFYSSLHRREITMVLYNHQPRPSSITKCFVADIFIFLILMKKRMSSLHHFQNNVGKGIQARLIEIPNIAKLKTRPRLFKHATQIYSDISILLIYSLKEYHKTSINPCLSTLELQIARILKTGFLIRLLISFN